MGERFYLAQKEYKPKRKLKADYIDYLSSILEVDLEGLDKMTIKNIEALTNAVENKLKEGA